MKFYRGLLYGTPISLLCWIVILTPLWTEHL